MAERPEQGRPLTLPHLIARRRLVRVRRRVRGYAALAGALAAGLAVAGFAVGDVSSVVPACTDTTATTTVTTTDACAPATTTDETAAATTTAETPAATTTADAPAPPPPAPDLAATPPADAPAVPDAAAPSPAPEPAAAEPAAAEPGAAAPPAALTVPAAPSAPAPVAQTLRPPRSPSPPAAHPVTQRAKPAVRRPRWPAAVASRPAARTPHDSTAPAPAPSAPASGASPAAAARTVPPASASMLVPAPTGPAAVASAAGLSLPPLAVGEATSFPGPPVLLPVYQAAAAQYHVPWTVLAAINEVETGFGKNVAVSSAGAVGWMQFMPSTWARYGLDADGDGVADPSDPVDAIFSAARYLQAAGGDHDVSRAVFAYNHAGWYVAKVLGIADGFQAIDPQVLTVLTYRGMADAGSLHPGAATQGYLAADTPIDSLGRAMLLDDAALGEQVIKDADVYSCGQEDIRAGRIDRRVLIVVEALSREGLHPTISSLECGHGFLTTSGNQSEHVTGDAVDIAAVNGTPILGHQGPGSITETVLRRIVALPGFLTAHQVISLMTVPGFPNTMVLPDHADHVHVGFHPVARGLAGK